MFAGPKLVAYIGRGTSIGSARGFMSWNNQGGGPWRSNQGPWGGGPSGGGIQPPGDLEEALRRLQASLRGILPGGGGFAGRGVVFILLVAILLWFAWGFYTVQPNEIGINLVFGRNAGKTIAGLNYNWAWPVGSVIKVPVTDQKITEVGYRSEQDAETGRNRAQAPEESLMLTADQNIVDVQFRVSWQIDPARPDDFVFNIRHPEAAVKAVAESVMREVVGLKTIDGILTTDRKSIEPDVQSRMQKVLNDYGAGVLVLQVQLQSVDAPAQVLDAYRDVTAAQQDQQRTVNDAETYANKRVPEAEGDAARIRLEAQAFRQQTVAEATGQTSRFNQVYAQYKNAPAVIRERMYLETMERILAGMDKTILDTSGVAAPVPYLPLDQLRNKPAGAVK
jgi:membrane protease subunit HflK